MILKTKKIADEQNQMVFKTALIAEDDVDRKILTEFNTGKVPAINQMIESLVVKEVNDIRECHKPDWQFEFRKSDGDSAYFIHLKKSKV